jgi:ATP-dependent RNA helicase RhlE
MSSYQLGLVSERPSTPVQPTPSAGHTAPSGAGAGQPASFAQLGLTPDLLRTVAAQGYTEPTPVQAQSIPIVLAGRDLLSSAQTGTGKTAAFVLPILQLLNASRVAPRPLPAGRSLPRGATGQPIRCLVLTPTRELALQIEESVRTYGAARPIRSTTIYGGVGFQPQVNSLRGGPEIVVATPGRLLDHAGQGTIDLGSVEILVLDEADRMLDMGFIRDIRRILALLPARRQNLLFSATFSDEIRELAAGLLHEPAEVQIARRNAAIELVRQVVYPVDRERKRELLSHLISSGRIDRALVFTRTKHGANRLAEQLGHDGILAAAIHGNKSQSQRVHALDDFKAGRVAVLVATEIAARGLDIDGLPHVVNFELPTVAQDYVHRIGRTGRAGMEGDAVSLVCIDENLLLADIETLLRQPVRREVVPGFEVDRSIKREPIRQRSGDVRPNSGRRPSAPRAAAPGGFRQSQPAPAPYRQAEPRAARQAAPARPRPMAPSEYRPAALSGFNQSAPVEPRRGPVGGFRRPVPSDFGQAAPAQSRRPAPSGTSIGYAPARRPYGGGGSPARQASPYRPQRQAASSGQANGGYRSEQRNAPASLPGERIARQGNREG